jgi:hypothetical protein
MSAKALIPGVLVLAWFCCSTVHGQPPAPLISGPAAQLPTVPDGTCLPQATVPGPTDLLPAAVHHVCPECHDPVGGNGPILFEAYLRNGVSLPFGAGPLARSLDPGWDIQGGVRTLFLNPPADAAWTLDFSISNIINHANMPDPVFLNLAGFPGPFPVRVSGLNRTFANLAGGREWYLLGPASSPGLNWRAGFDAGGRWGSAKLDLADFHRRTEVMTGAFAAVHSDVEFPCCGCLWYAGVRAEWSYTWSHILQQNGGDIQDINLMFTLGVHF